LNSLIKRFSSTKSLKTNLEKEIEETESIIKEYSNILGEKIRENEDSSADDPEFLAFQMKKSQMKKSQMKKSQMKKSQMKKNLLRKKQRKKRKNKRKALVTNGII
jgi:hypothetical protein